MPRIYLVDDHPVIRESYALLIELEDGFTLAGEAETAAQALAEVSALGPDLVVVDVQLPDMNGVDLVAALCARLPGLPVIVASGHDDRELARRAYEAGARAYLPKHEAADRLADTIRAVLATSAEASAPTA
jgi:DNA-binding NarL/FixJ family response regulator